MKKKSIKLLAMLAAVICLLGAALSVTAAPYIENGPLTEEDAQMYSDSSQLEMVFALVLSDTADEMLPALEKSGDYFYETMAKQVKETKADLGNFISVKSLKGEIKNYELSLTYMLECEKLDAEVLATFKVDLAAGSLTPLNFTLNPQYPVGVNMANAGRNTIIGIAIVFAILAFLSFVISLLKFTNPANRQKKQEPVKEEKKQEEKPVSVPEPVAEEVPVYSNDEEIVAVIAAAIAAAEADGSADDNSTYRVSSIRRVASSKRWKRA